MSEFLRGLSDSKWVNLHNGCICLLADSLEWCQNCGLLVADTHPFDSDRLQL